MIVAPSVELQLLLQCCRHQFRPDSFFSDQISGLPGVNWDRFLALVSHHKLFPLVHQVLKTHQQSVPDPVWADIASSVSKSQRRIMNLTGVLAQVHQLFNDNGLPYLAIKGPVMIRQLYGDALLRQTRDIDLLVEPGTIDKAIMVLIRAGFLLQDAYFIKNPEKRILYMARENHVRFRHPEKMIYLELHWSVSKYFTTIPVNILLNNAITVDLQGIPFPTLPPEDYFVILAVHGIYHRYEHLFWLYDLAHIMNRPDVRMSKVLSRAAEFKCLIPVRVSMALAIDFFYNGSDLKGLPTPLARREKFIRAQCIRTIFQEETRTHGPLIKRVVDAFNVRLSRQLFLIGMTGDWSSAKRVVLNALIKPYVWPDDLKLPKNNLLYLCLTQWRWFTMMVTGKMTRKGRVRNIDHRTNAMH